MRKIIFLLLAASILGGCAIAPDEATYLEAKRNFRYEADKANEFRVYDHIDREFRGDCEDFAFTLQRQIGGEVWYVILSNVPYPYHAVLVKDGFVYDNRTKWPVYVDRYSAEFVFIMHPPKSVL